MAASNEDSLEILLSKATSPLNREDDIDCITLFAEKIDKEFEGPQTSTRLLAHKIQSPQEHEALQALVVLEFCVKNCDKNFHNEVGKYRFLNELIKVVSPKYLGEKTTQKVRDKVVQLLYVWSLGLKEQMKIRDAYQMLKQQGIVKKDPEYDDMMLIPTPTPRDERDNIFKNDERQKRLEILLKSKNPEDLQAANRLIKSVVMEDQHRMEKIEKRCKMLEEVSNNVRLLNEMLAQYDPQATPQTAMETMKELHNGCVKLRPGLFRLASDTHDDEQALMDILRANDDLSRVIQSYEKLVLPRLAIDRKGDGEEAEKPSEQPTKPKSSLIDLAELEMNSQSTDQNSLLGSLHAPASTNGANNLFHMDSNPAATTTDDIASLFASMTSQPTMMTSQPTMMTSHQPMMTSQQPMMTSQPSMMASPQQSLFGQQSFQTNKPTNTVPLLLPPPSSNNKKAGLSDIDLLSQDLLEKTLGRKPEEKFAPRTTSKPTLNQLSQPIVSNVKDPAPQPTDLLDQLLAPATVPTVTSTQNILGDQESFADFMSVPPKTSSDTLLAATTAAPTVPTNQMQTTVATPLFPANQATESAPVPILPLTDVHVPLESIKPSTLPPLTVYDHNGLRVLFHFAQDFATPERKDTLVTVVSIMSTRPSPIPNIVLQVAVPKIMRVKLQTPSSTKLGAFNPIVPSPPVTQVMILANPNKKEVKMRFKLDYKLDEQTSFSETGEITGFPPSEKWGCL